MRGPVVRRSGLRFLFVLGAAAASIATGQPTTNQSCAVLDDSSYWRSHMTVSPPMYGKTVGDARPDGERPRSQPPPDNWKDAGFDDSGWRRATGRVFEGYGWTRKGGGSLTAAQLCLRGKFLVNDPAAVKSLTFSAVYRGGMVVYLNGKEAARGNVAAGAVAPETMAQEYPWEAYVGTNSQGFTPKTRLTAEQQARIGTRIRRLDNVPLPVDALRKGVNVVAVDLRRAPLDPDGNKLGWEAVWGTMGLMSMTVTAPGGGVEPNLVRPKGIQVWSADPMTTVFDTDHGDPAESLRPIRLACARGASYSGQVIVSSDQPIRKLAAKISDLALAGGQGGIAAGETRIRYALPTGQEDGASSRGRGTWKAARFDALAETAPETVPVAAKSPRKDYTGAPLVPGAVQPVWITVKVPRDAAPGEYSGKLTLSADGMTPADVAVNLRVADWAAPDPKEFSSHVGIIDSPESEALYYKKPMWSEEHWALVSRAMRYMGEAGNSAMFLPLFAKHHFGREGMVRWVAKPDGTFDYDFKVFDRYVDLALEHMGKPQVVCLYAWEPARVGSRNKQPLEVTANSPTGGVTEIIAPDYRAPEALAFWKPVMEACRERLVKRGVEEKALMVGMASDRHPDKPDVELFKAAAPWARWVKQAHGDVGQFFGVPVGHLAFVWGTHGLKDPSEKRIYYWRTEQVRTIFPRCGACRLLRSATPATQIWPMQEYLVAAGYRGVGRIGADFWPVFKGAGRHYGGDTMAGMYANWGQTTISESTLDLLYPGPEGALGTLRLETFRQGVLEAEARICIDRALTDKAVSAKLGPDLAARAQALLDARARLMLAYDGDLHPWYQSSGWQQGADALYAMAAEVARTAAGGAAQ